MKNKLDKNAAAAAAAFVVAVACVAMVACSRKEPVFAGVEDAVKTQQIHDARIKETMQKARANEGWQREDYDAELLYYRTGGKNIVKFHDPDTNNVCYAIEGANDGLSISCVSGR